MTDPLLRIDGLRVEIAGRGRTVRALDGIDLALAPGESLGIVGESGCGKTLTALSVLGLLPPGGRVTGGRILFGGTDLAAAPEPVLREVRGHSAARRAVRAPAGRRRGHGAAAGRAGDPRTPGGLPLPPCRTGGRCQ